MSDVKIQQNIVGLNKLTPLKDTGFIWSHLCQYETCVIPIL